MLSQLLRYDHATVILYISIVVFSTLFASMSQSKIYVDETDSTTYRVTKKGPFLVSFFILAFFASTTGVGIDRSAYAYFFRISSFGNTYKDIEPGFRLLMAIIKLFTSNEYIFLGIIGFSTVALVFKGIWDLRDKLPVGLAVFLFAGQYYFQSFNLMRMFFAMSFLIAGAKLVFEGKHGKYLLLIAFSATIHYSMLFVGAAYVIGLVLRYPKSVSFEFRFVFLLFAMAVFSLVAVRLALALLGTDSAIIRKYAIYLNSISVSSLGFKWIFNLFPYVIMFPFARHTENRMANLVIPAGYLLVTLVVSIMSYSVPVIGRAVICLNMPIVIMLPAAIESYERNRILNSGEKLIVEFEQTGIEVSYRHIMFMIYAYFAFAMLLDLSGYIGSAGIDNFHFIWN